LEFIFNLLPVSLLPDFILGPLPKFEQTLKLCKGVNLAGATHGFFLGTLPLFQKTFVLVQELWFVVYYSTHSEHFAHVLTSTKVVGNLVVM